MDKDRYIQELEAVNGALKNEVIVLRKKQRERNTLATNKWRSKAFYLKRKAEVYLEYMRIKGLTPPAV